MRSRLDVIRMLRKGEVAIKLFEGHMLYPYNDQPRRHLFNVKVFISFGTIYAAFSGNCSNDTNMIRITSRQLLYYIRRHYKRGTK